MYSMPAMREPFDLCCRGAEAYQKHRVRCHRFFVKDPYAAKCPIGSTDCIVDEDSLPGYPDFDWNEVNRTALRENPYLRDGNVLAGLALANTLDCRLFAAAVEIFVGRVLDMQEATGLTFLHQNIVEFGSTLCLEGLMRNVTFYGNKTDMDPVLLTKDALPQGCPRMTQDDATLFGAGESHA